MRDSREQINPGHERWRRTFRILGPIVLGAGIIAVVAAFASFVLAFGGPNPPRLFWLGFVGLPLVFVGAVLTNAGYMGAVARYVAQEQAPVAADAINYLADETRPAARSVAAAVRDGLAAPARVCPACNAANDADARFCDSCGHALQRACAACHAANDPDANFCDSCGQALA